MRSQRAASRPPTAQGLADKGVQENQICTRVVAQRGPLAATKAGWKHFPSVEHLCVESRCSRGLYESAGKKLAEKTRIYDLAMQGPHSGPAALPAVRVLAAPP